MHPGVVHLTGGLGNQLFGFYFAKSLCLIQNRQIFVNKANLEPRGFQLAPLETSLVENLATREYGKKTFNKKDLIQNRFTRKIYFERAFSFNPNLINSRYLEYYGYFQSWKYLESLKSSIQEDFNQHISNIIGSNLYFEFPQQAYVAIHIRRGDYVNLQNYHGLTTKEYFQNSMRYLREYHGIDLPVLVFSDDIDKAKEIIPDAFKYVAKEDTRNDWDTLLLMANAQALVGSNSSFSWWAAYGGNSKVAIFPEPWFQNRKIDSSDLLHPDWICLGI